MTITGQQLRAARAILRWTAQNVADAARVGVATVRRAELQEGALGVTAANEAAIQRALEAAGIEFIPQNGGGAGVRMRTAEPVDTRVASRATAKALGDATEAAAADDTLWVDEPKA